MAQGGAIATVYTAGVVQGLGLVTFPAASGVFTSPAGFGLSNAEYGGMFVPQAITAILASLVGAGLGGRLGIKGILLMGLLADLLAMGLLVGSSLVRSQHLLAYVVLLIATGCMGIGFGFAVPALNTLVAAFFPQQADKAVLALNALLGLGTALAPVLVAIFVGLGHWWGLPVLVGSLTIGLLLVGMHQPLQAGEPSRTPGSTQPRERLPARFWLFGAFTLLYGLCETMNGNWASIYLATSIGAGAATAALGLAVFWGSVTAGRILFAAIDRWLTDRRVFQILPVLLAAACAGTACVHRGDASAGVIGFAAAGLGCSALLPLAISFGQRDLSSIGSSVAGGLIAFYQIGYGLAAFSVGPLKSVGGIDLNVIFIGTAVTAMLMWIVALAITRSPLSPSSPSSPPPPQQQQKQQPRSST